MYSSRAALRSSLWAANSAKIWFSATPGRKGSSGALTSGALPSGLNWALAPTPHVISPTSIAATRKDWTLELVIAMLTPRTFDFRPSNPRGCAQVAPRRHKPEDFTPAFGQIEGASDVPNRRLEPDHVYSCGWQTYRVRRTGGFLSRAQDLSFGKGLTYYCRAWNDWLQAEGEILGREASREA